VLEVMSAKCSGRCPQGQRLVARNRRASHDYEIQDRYEAGLVLIGSEARSLRFNGADLTDAWVDIDRRGEAWVKGLRIPVVEHAAFGHQERRDRKLLLHADQIERLRAAIERGGMTVIATKCYYKNNRAKLEVALARGKRKYDKRQRVRERDAAREAEQAIRRVRLG
jgi:SsrA-binding protein